MRTGATATPEFWLKDSVRNTLHGLVISSDVEMTIKDIAESILFVTGVNKNPRLQQLWDEFLEDGGGMGNFLNDIIIRHNSFYREVTGRKSLADYNPVRALQHGANVNENVTRFTVYRKGIEKGLSRKEAAFRSMDVQDFGMAGRAVRPLNRVLPFFNSPIQSKYKLFRALKEDPKSFVVRAIAVNIPITMANLALKAMASDDQKRRIEEAHAYIKENFWLVPSPFSETIYRIPKPFDTSVFLANTLEHFFDYATAKAPMTAWEALKDWGWENFIHCVLPSSMFPQVLNVMGEASTGYNQFYGMDVVPMSLQDEAPMNQFTVATPHILIGWGRAMDKIGLGETWLASPMRVQSIINTTFGGMGTLTLDMANLAFLGINEFWDLVLPGDQRPYREKVMGKRPYTEDWFSDIMHVDAEQFPIARTFLLKNDYGTSINDVYRKLETLDKKKSHYDKLMDSGMTEAANRAMPEKDRELYFILKDEIKVRQAFEDANGIIRDFRDSPHLSGAEKGYWMNEVQRERGRLARETLVFVKMYEAGLTPETLSEQEELSAEQCRELKGKIKELEGFFGNRMEQKRQEEILKAIKEGEAEAEARKARAAK